MRILTKNGHFDFWVGHFFIFFLFKSDKMGKRTQIGTGMLLASSVRALVISILLCVWWYVIVPGNSQFVAFHFHYGLFLLWVCSFMHTVHLHLWLLCKLTCSETQETFVKKRPTLLLVCFSSCVHLKVEWLTNETMNLCRVIVVTGHVNAQEVNLHRMLLPHPMQKHHHWNPPINLHSNLLLLHYGHLHPDK